MKAFWISALLLVLHLAMPYRTWAAQPTPELSENKALPKALQVRIETHLAALTATAFSPLANANIEIKAIEHDTVFLATDINMQSLFFGPRHYVLYVNPQLHTGGISDDALQGILAHELVHFSHYEKMNTVELAWFYSRYLISDEFVAHYERNTDLQAFELGYALGIKNFRFWLYEQISETGKVSKIKNYYTPEQIDNWLLDNLIQGEVTIL